jgi:type IV secretion system protein VirB2/type IV secretion system protein PtlA
MKTKLRQLFTPRVCSFLLCLGLLTIAGAAPAFAQGLDRVNTLLDSVLGILRGVSITVVTIAIIWAGYKFLFKSADLGECAKILGGGILIGGAAEIAGLLLN